MDRGPRNSRPIEAVARRGHDALDRELDDRLALERWREVLAPWWQEALSIAAEQARSHAETTNAPQASAGR